MSAERRFDKRRFELEESTSRNGGARTIFVEYMTPGTSVPPHFHSRFAETFDLISGSMSVYSTTESSLGTLEASVQELEVGNKVTINPGVYHQYKDADGELKKMGDSVELMAVVMGLSDAHLIGPAKEMLDGVSAEKKDEIKALRKELLAKYDTEEALEGLLV